MVYDFRTRSYQPDGFFNTKVPKILSRFINLFCSNENRTPGDELKDFVFTPFTLQHMIKFKHVFTLCTSWNIWSKIKLYEYFYKTGSVCCHIWPQCSKSRKIRLYNCPIFEYIKIHIANQFSIDTSANSEHNICFKLTTTSNMEMC